MINYQIVTPERLLSDKDAEMVVIPGTEGDFGVLVGHSPLISSIRPGVIRIYEGNDVKERILVTGGFAEVTPERCTILATEAYFFSDTSKEAMEKRFAAAKKIHEDAELEHEKIVAKAEVDVAEAILEAFINENDHRK